MFIQNPLLYERLLPLMSISKMQYFIKFLLHNDVLSCTHTHKKYIDFYQYASADKRLLMEITDHSANEQVKRANEVLTHVAKKQKFKNHPH